MSGITKLLLIIVASLCVSFMGKKPDSKAGSGRAKNIDGLRAILNLIIVLFHFGQTYSLGPIFRGGWFAVEIFFMLSGFLLISGAVRKGDSFSPAGALKSRIKRMYPAYLAGTVSLILLYAVTWFGGNPVAWLHSNSRYPVAVLIELLGLQTTGLSKLVYINGPAWYVSALMIATAILAVLYSRLRKNIFPIAFVLSVTLYGLMFVCCPDMPTSRFFLNTVIPVPLMRAVAGMCLGIVVYGISSSSWFDTAYRKLERPDICMSMCLLLVLLPLLFLEFSRAFFLLLVPAALIISFGFRGCSSVFDIVLESRPIQFLGRISFSFYIMQSFSQNVIGIYFARFTQNHWLLNIVYVAFNLAISVVVYLLLEKHHSSKERQK